jgi:hypothetical protein
MNTTPITWRVAGASPWYSHWKTAAATRIAIDCRCKIPNLPDSKGDSRDEIPAEAVLEPVQNFFAPVTDDFAQPDIAVDVHEEGPVAQASGLGVGNNRRVDEIVPNFNYFRLRSAAINPQT